MSLSNVMRKAVPLLISFFYGSLDVTQGFTLTGVTQ